MSRFGFPRHPVFLRQLRHSRFNPKSFARSHSSQPPKASRIDRIASRLPRSLRKYTDGLRNAPVSHVVSFLILHELTAIVPLVGLVGLFHYTDYVPVSYMTDHFGTYVRAGLDRFERYFKRKGWFGFSQADDEATSEESQSQSGKPGQGAMERWESGDPKYKILVEVALAYAITKALLPLRIIGSVWATPWCANLFMRMRRSFGRKV